MLPGDGNFEDFRFGGGGGGRFSCGDFAVSGGVESRRLFIEPPNGYLLTTSELVATEDDGFSTGGATFESRSALLSVGAKLVSTFDDAGVF